MTEEKKTKVIYYSKLIICLSGLLIILLTYIPILIFFMIKLKWNLNGIIIRAGFISGLVFLFSYFYHLFPKKRLRWIVLNVIAMGLLAHFPFTALKLIIYKWDKVSSVRFLNHIFDMMYSFSFYSLPAVSTVILIISFALGMLAIYRLKWIAGISFTIIIVLSSMLAPSRIFYSKQKPVFGNISLGRDINLIAKSRAIKGEFKDTPLIDMDMLNGRDLFVFPERKELFAFFGMSKMRFKKKSDLFLYLDYGSNAVKYQIYKEMGSIKRAKLSLNGSKIYIANWYNGT